MSGSLIIPPAVNYQAPIVSIPTLYRNEPKEGPRMVPITIPWGNAGADNCVYINTSQNTPNPISQIVALAVDNTRCGADVIFSFPDTQQTITVPTGESVVMPVFTGSLAFYVLSPDALSTDVTNLTIHNSMPPAIDINKSRFQSFSVSAPVNPGAITQMLPDITGTINSISLSTNGGGYGNFYLADQPQEFELQASFSTSGNLCCSMNGLAVRFKNGIQAQFSASYVTSGATLEGFVNIAYTVP
jgi:hypothetical protein